MADQFYQQMQQQPQQSRFGDDVSMVFDMTTMLNLTENALQFNANTPHECVLGPTSAMRAVCKSETHSRSPRAFACVAPANANSSASEDWAAVLRKLPTVLLECHDESCLEFPDELGGKLRDGYTVIVGADDKKVFRKYARKHGVRHDCAWSVLGAAWGAWSPSGKFDGASDVTYSVFQVRTLVRVW